MTSLRLVASKSARQEFFYDYALHRAAMNMNSISRSSERRPLSLLVKSRVQSRVVFVDMIDISEGGCKIRGSRGFAQIGDRVSMRIDGVNAPLGTVAWVEDKVAGVAFEGEMHSAVLDHLCQQKAFGVSSGRSGRSRVL